MHQNSHLGCRGFIFTAVLFLASTIQVLADPPQDTEQHRMGASPFEKFVTLDRVKYTTSAEFRAAIERLPRGATLKWDWGCFEFQDMPFEESPRMSIAAFEQFCTEHAITLKHGHYSGW